MVISLGLYRTLGLYSSTKSRILLGGNKKGRDLLQWGEIYSEVRLSTKKERDLHLGRLIFSDRKFCFKGKRPYLEDTYSEII